MKLLCYYFPETCIVVLAALSGVCFVHFGMTAAHQVLTILVLFMLFLIMRIARRNEMNSNPAKRLPPTLENPRQLKHLLILFCEDNLTNYRTVLRALTAKGPMLEPPDTDLSGPSDLDLYFEALDSLTEIGDEMSHFVTTAIHCQVASRRTRGTSPDSAIVIEATRPGYVGLYTFVVSPAKTRYHFRIQIGLAIPADQ